jgi:hypothetical protein
VLAVAHASAVGSEVLQHTSTVRAVIFIGEAGTHASKYVEATSTPVHIHHLSMHACALAQHTFVRLCTCTSACVARALTMPFIIISAPLVAF